MRFRKGSKVEVLSKCDVPTGAWRCAEIIWGNGHNYTVRYYIFPGSTDDNMFVERVSRKSIRPCPPPTEYSANCMPGDVVEVVHNSSWKIATVSKVLGRNYYLVRLVGSFQEFKATKYDVRVRQSWQDDQWIVIGKGSGKNNGRSDLKYNQSSGFQIEQANAKMNLHVKDCCVAARDNINFQESHIVPSRTLKRASSYYFSPFEAHKVTAQKFRKIEKESGRHGVPVTIPCLSPEKVDASLTREMLGEKYMHASFNKRTTGFSEMDAKREKWNGVIGYSHAISLEPNDSDNATCSSVDSCSVISNNVYRVPYNFTTGPVEDNKDHGSDAESFCHLGYEEGNCPLPTKEELAEEIHRLELHAYRRTMEALHASGPLSWEQETLVTDLRISLHISNDEYLMELRNLISPATSIPIC